MAFPVKASSVQDMDMFTGSFLGFRASRPSNFKEVWSRETRGSWCVDYLLLEIKIERSQPFHLFEVREIKGDGGNGYPVSHKGL